MRVCVTFYSYFKELAGCAQLTEELPDGATLQNLRDQLLARFPKIAPMKKSMLIAVGVEYQPPAYQLKEGDIVSLFPPVQGG